MGCLCVLVSNVFQAALCTLERLASKLFYSIILCAMFCLMILLCVYGVTLGYHYSKKEIINYKLTSTVAYRFGFRRAGGDDAPPNEQSGRRSNQDVQDAIRSFKLDQLTLKKVVVEDPTTKPYSSPMWYPSIDARLADDGDEGEDRDRELLQQLNLLNDIQPSAPPARLKR